MKVVMDDKAVEAIVSMVMDLQDKENTSLPLYEQQLQEAQRGIDNLLNAIQQGILTKSTKTRLEELEATKEDLEIKIANEKIAKPRISPEFVTFWIHKFRKLDVRQQSHRKMLIDAFVNAIYLYDDKMVITFDYKDGTRTIALEDVKEAVQKNTGSDLDCLAAPKTGISSVGIPVFRSDRTRIHFMRHLGEVSAVTSGTGRKVLLTHPFFRPQPAFSSPTRTVWQESR